MCPVEKCERYAAKRREWRRIADPNTRAVGWELVREELRRMAGDKSERAAPGHPLFRDVAAEFIAANVCAPIYSEGVKLRGMKDHKGVAAIIERTLIPALGSRPVYQITFAELQAVRDARLTSPKLRGGKTIVETTGQRSIARVNREMSVLRAIMNFAIDSGYIARNPMTAGSSSRKRSLVVMGAERPRERVMTFEEERRLHVTYEASNARRSHNYFTVAADTGLRESEMFGLTAGDCDFTAKQIVLPWAITKSKRARTIPMSERVRAILAARCRARTPGEPVFSDLTRTIVRNDFRNVKAAANVVDLHLHDMRATVATRLLQAGISEAEIAMMTGHRMRAGGRDESATAPVLRRHYLRLTPETITRAAAAIDGSEGRVM
jgi:integrase